MYTAQLDNPSPADIVQEGCPDRRDKQANQFDTTTPSVGAGMRWAPDETLDLTPDAAPSVASGPGLPSGAAGQISLAELKRRARAQRTDDPYPEDITKRLEDARKAVANGEDPDELEPIDAT